MQGLSYREYLQPYHNIELPIVTLQDILKNSSDICSDVLHKCRPLEFFAHYLNQGYYPFGTDGFGIYNQRVENVVDLLLNIELPQLRKIDIGNIRKIKALLSIIATQVPKLVDISKLATLTGIARTTMLAYLQYLNEAKLIRLLYSNDLSVKKMQKPDKMLMENSNLLKILSLKEPEIGTMRETFFCNQMSNNNQVEYSKHGDFLINHEIAFEVGGKTKDGKQIAKIENSYIAADNIDYPMGNKIPLWLFGLMY